MLRTSFFYFFLVLLLSNCGSESGGSGDPTPNLVVPNALAASEITENSFRANWESVSGAENYLLDVATDRSFNSFINGFNERSVSQTNFTVNGLNPNTEYFYRVKAQSGTVKSPVSGVISLKTAAANAPSPSLSAPQAQNASNITHNSFRANWNLVTGASEYLLDVSTDQNFGSFVNGFQNRRVSQNFVDVTALQAATNYFYRVRAVQGSTNSVFSNVISLRTANPPTTTQEFPALESFINAEMSANRINGLAALMIKNNEVVWKKGFGKANVAENKNVDTETVFMIASVSKTVTGVVLMTLFDQGKFKLDDDINKYLPFKIVNPNFPNDIITIRMLLSHTSSIQDETYDAISKNITYRFGTDHPETLANFMKDCLSPDGKYYGAEVFTKNKPGSKTVYSNLASALCGYLVETISGESFNSYSKKVLSPLGFRNSAWALRDVNLSNSAIPYNSEGGVIGHYSFVDFPNGGFRTNVDDFAKYMIMLMNFGTYNGVKILERSTVEEMFKAQRLGDGEFGLLFVVSDGSIGHGGSEQGVIAQMHFDPVKKIGVFLAANRQSDSIGEKIYKRILEEAAK